LNATYDVAFPLPTRGIAGWQRQRRNQGRKKDRARVAGGQDYEARYTEKKTKRSAGAVKKAVKKVGSSRKRVERRLGR